MQKLSAVPSEAADNHRSLPNPSSEPATPTSSPPRSGAVYSLGDFCSSPGRRGDPFPPAFHAHTAAPGGHRGTVGVGNWRPASPASPPLTRERGSVRTGVLPEHLRPQTRSPAPAAVQMPQRDSLTPPLRPGLRPRAPTRDPPTPRRPRRRPARGSALPGAAPPRSRKPEAAGECQSQGRCPAELPAPVQGLRGRVARPVFLGKPLLRHSFILLASGCSLK